MANQYFYLISGLPDISFGDTKQKQTSIELKKELLVNITKEDWEYLNLYYLQYDNQNVLSILEKEEFVYNNLSVYTEDVVNEEIKRIKEEGATLNGLLPSYLQEFIEEYYNDTSKTDKDSWENILSLSYYTYSIKTNNKIIASYFKFHLNLNNFLTAKYAGIHGIDYEKEVIGNDEIAKTIRKSKTSDFGLSNDFPYLSQLVQITDIKDVVEREKKIDNLLWDHLDQEVFFSYFDIERVFAYLVKLGLLERWLNKSDEKGKKQFESILGDLQSSYTFPEKYLKK